jgi:hypothetical protein
LFLYLHLQVLLSQFPTSFYMRSLLIRVFKQLWLVVVYQCCGTAHGSRLQGSSSQRRIVAISSWTAWPLKVGPIGCAETSVNKYQLCLKSQMSKDLNYTVAGARNFLLLILISSSNDNLLCKALIIKKSM